MKKIIGGILGIFLVIGIVAGTGYALFSDTVSISGMVLGTANPNLQIRTDEDGYTAWATSLNFYNNDVFAPLLPGEYDWGEFYLRNISDGTTDPLDMNISARITSAGGDWGVLSGAVQMAICIYDEAAPNHCGAVNTGWKTLAQWNASSYDLPGNPLPQGPETTNIGTHYAIVFFVDSTYTNSIANKTITNMNILIEGEQVL